MNHKITQVFGKALIVLSLFALALYVVHLVLSVIFWGPKVFGCLFGATLAWVTYFNYRYNDDDNVIVVGFSTGAGPPKRGDHVSE